MKWRLVAVLSLLVSLIGAPLTYNEFDGWHRIIVNVMSVTLVWALIDGRLQTVEDAYRRGYRAGRRDANESLKELNLTTANEDPR